MDVNRIIRLLEEPLTDEEARKKARRFADMLVSWLGDVGNHQHIEPVVGSKWDGGMAFSCAHVDRAYSDINVLLMPTSDENEGGIGFGGTSTLIVLYCLLGRFDLRYVSTRVRRATVIHEFIHHLDRQRQTVSTNTKEMLAQSRSDYYNDPSEFNAYYQVLAASLENLAKGRSGHKLTDVNQFLDIAFKLGQQEWLEFISPKYKRKLIRRLYQLHNHLFVNSGT